VKPLDTDVRYIKGVGEAKAKLLARLEIHTLADLVRYFPRAYEDRTVFLRIGELMPGENACVVAMVAAAPRLTHIRKGLDIVRFRAVDETGALEITYFNQSYRKDAFQPGQSYAFYGKVEGSGQRKTMANPQCEPEERIGTVTGRIVPIYPLTAGLNQRSLTAFIRQGLDECGSLMPEALPESVRRQYQLCDVAFAYENIHFPKDEGSLEIARRRLIFEELFVLSAAMGRLRRAVTEKTGKRLDPACLEAFYSALPYHLTGAQRRAIEEAMGDMSSGRVMSRLIQGDVGSGKTAVAAACCFVAAKSGYQAAFMAPTEILARQHYQSLGQMLEPLGLRFELLTGSMTAKQRREAKERIALGMADVVVGTHALISEAVAFDRLALVVTDEQHRFGVAQRAALTEKGESPHVLVMSATPIPRTLALIIYGELDVSIIDEMPPGRQTIDTFAVAESMRPRINNFIRKLVSEGRQVYVVCPMVEENDALGGDVKSAQEHAKELEQTFPDLRVGLVHGKMKPKAKQEIMAAFVAGQLDILVATTVIEVGVDVPNAVLMVVENADRFGLSQLHQLRGRVGRGKHKSYCVLFEGGGGETARARLKVMCQTNDGFKISEQDLELRGPGDFFGSRQHGLPQVQLAGAMSNMEVLKLAQQAAGKVLERDPTLSLPENKKLADQIEAIFSKSENSFN
jgi:ATP-dependent DNA helicase RecG